MQVSQYQKRLSQQPEDGFFDDVYLFSPKTDRAERVCREIVRCLRADCRMSLTKMSRELGVPVSTLHDNLRRLRSRYHLRLKLDRKRGERA